MAKVRFNKKTGYIDKDGVLIIPIIYNKANFYNDVIVAWKDSKWGILNKEGKILAPFIYNKIGSFEKNGLAVASIVNNKGKIKNGFINQKGQLVIPLIYYATRSFQNNLAGVEVSPNKWGYIDDKGKIKIEPKYVRVDDFDENGFARVSTIDDTHFVNPKGEVVVGYVDKGDFVGNGDLTRTIDEYEQIINTKGEIIRLLKKEQTK
ncbi:MAG: hypothetical protein KU29_13860 [Sulfurovum sp. FS06-10]|nr:MAG: hypothetical protein KU29_13860 [Sulfurovum sp. FS06-10]